MNDNGKHRGTAPAEGAKAPPEKQDKCPAPLREGGLADAILRRADRRAQKAGDKALLKAVADMTEFRHKKLPKLVEYYWQPGHGTVGRVLFLKVVTEAAKDTEDGHLDLYALCLLPDDWYDQLSTGAKYRAAAYYVAAPQRARALFVKDLPENFGEWAEAVGSDANLHPTALGDWDVFMRRRKRQKAAQPGLPTGLTVLDQAIGGLRGLTVISGPSGGGKTTLTLQLVAGVLPLAEDVGALWITTETPKYQLQAKLLSYASGVPYRDLEGDTAEEHEAAVRAGDAKLRATVLPRLKIIDLTRKVGSGQPLTFDALMRLHADFKAVTGVKRVVTVVDSLQRLELPYRPVRGDGSPPDAPLSDLEADVERFKMFVQLRSWTRTDDCLVGEPILVLSQVRKPVAGAPTTKEDVRGHYGIIHDADCVFLVGPATSSTEPAEVTPTRLCIDKVRDGGRRGDLRLDFHHLVSKFVESTAPLTPRAGLKRRRRRK